MGRQLVSDVRRRLGIRTRARDAWQATLEDRYAGWRSRPLRERSVLYEAFGGNGVLDNPEAIFRYLLDQPDMADLEHVWALRSPEHHAEVVAEFADHPRVRFVRPDSAGYYRALATSKYLINNATFQQRFAKRDGQVYVNTWHGVPVKHMGVDMPNGAIESRNILRNFLNADYLLSANAYMTDTMYRRAYRLQGIYRGAIIEEGQPRADRQTAALADPDGTRRQLEDRGLQLGGRRVVLYAPTWRGESFGSPWVNTSQLVATVRELQESLDPERVLVLLKVHQVIYDLVREHLPDPAVLVPNSLPTNVVLAATDVLVTDYSSVFFDFVPTGRPVVHYVPDLDTYASTRGLYLTEDQLAGPVCATSTELAGHVAAGLEQVSSSEAAPRPLPEALVTPHHGSVCERVVDVVFRGRPENDYRVHRDFVGERRTLLIYLGSMKSQGITTSALNLLRHIDYDTYDVTAFFPFSRGRDRARNQRLVDPRVRVIARAPVFVATRRRLREETRNLMVRGLPEVFPRAHVEFWETEWQRMFGSARFDHLLDFSGYGCYSPFLYSVVEAEHKSIWLHNDMYADMQRGTDDRHLEDRLSAVFSTYNRFDSLVSVSRELNQVNQVKLADFAPPELFTYALNTMDTGRVLRMAGVSSQAELRAPAAGDPGVGVQPGRAADPPAPATDWVSVPRDNIAGAMSVLLEHYEPREVIAEARGRSRLSRVPSVRGATFVSVGRLSPEKNHTRLIKAFARVHEHDPRVHLVIVGGGDLERRLHDLVSSLGLSTSVTLTGQVDNPYAIMREADCFVLSSDYEGQPMVILEARALGLPIVTTAFSSVRDSVPDDAGVVTPLTVEGLADGMRRFLDGEVPAHTLDADDYNQAAMRLFYQAIDKRA